MTKGHPRAKIVSLGQLVYDEAPLTVETSESQRHVFVLTRDQLRLLHQMAERALEEPLIALIASDVLVFPPSDVPSEGS